MEMTQLKRIGSILADQSGYTLVETLVAMVIFLSVLIPVGFGATSLLLDRKAEDLRAALLLAEATMATQKFEKDETIHGRYIVKTEIMLSGGLMEFRVTVAHTKKPSAPLVVLSKMIQSPL
jgi:prepilin-type N-terminal cleavage/methylation domain-containing protein